MFTFYTHYFCLTLPSFTLHSLIFPHSLLLALIHSFNVTFTAFTWQLSTYNSHCHLLTHILYFCLIFTNLLHSFSTFYLTFTTWPHTFPTFKFCIHFFHSYYLIVLYFTLTVLPHILYLYLTLPTFCLAFFTFTSHSLLCLTCTTSYT